MEVRDNMGTATPHSDDNAFHPGPGLERIVFFSDAVIAIAVTLLAIDIMPPEAGLTPLPVALTGITLRIAVFALSFLIIGSFWVGHHVTFTFIQKYDYKLVWLNLVFLLFVALIPFGSSLLGTYQFEQTAVMIYSAIIALAGFSRAAIWEYAVRNHRLIDKDVPLVTIRHNRIRNLIAPISFAVSVPLVMINIAYVAVWGIVPLSMVVYRNIARF
jgi:uncharacterized membrane protein